MNLEPDHMVCSWKARLRTGREGAKVKEERKGREGRDGVGINKWNNKGRKGNQRMIKEIKDNTNIYKK